MEMLQRKSLLTWLVQTLTVRSFVIYWLYLTEFNIFKTVCLQVENGFILLLEKEIFIDQLKDIMDKAEDMLNEDMEGERTSTLSCSSQKGQISEGLVGEVRGGVVYIDWNKISTATLHMLKHRFRHGQRHNHGHGYILINTQ